MTFNNELADTPIGAVDELAVLLWYDGPRAQALQSDSGQLFVNMHASSTADQDVWLYVPVSPSRLSLIVNGAFEWRNVFTQPETILYVVTWAENEVTVVERTPEDIPETWFPSEGVFMSLDTALELNDTEEQAFNTWISHTRGNFSHFDAFKAGRDTLRQDASAAIRARELLTALGNPSDADISPEDAHSLLQQVYEALNPTHGSAGATS